MQELSITLLYCQINTIREPVLAKETQTHILLSVVDVMLMPIMGWKPKAPRTSDTLSLSVCASPIWGGRCPHLDQDKDEHGDKVVGAGHGIFVGQAQ